VQAQWKSFKDKTDFDRRWGTTKHHATRYYWLSTQGSSAALLRSELLIEMSLANPGPSPQLRAVTGHRLGPEITFAATAGVLTLVATRKGSLCAHAHTHLSNHSLLCLIILSCAY
jgi:hypothetical protein